MLRVLEQALVVSRGGDDYIVTWLDATPGHIEGGSVFFINFYFKMMASVTQTAVSLLSITISIRSCSVGIALIIFFFCFIFWEILH